MCDYSLYELKTRTADEDERLFINRFKTGSKGFASEADYQAAMDAHSRPKGPTLLRWIHKFCSDFWQHISPPSLPDEVCANLPAICLPYGAKLKILSSPDDTQNESTIPEIGSMIGQTVRLIQLTDESFGHRDAIVLDSDNERPISLQKLPVGLVAQALSLNLSSEEETEVKLLRANAASSYH